MTSHLLDLLACGRIRGVPFQFGLRRSIREHRGAAGEVEVANADDSVRELGAGDVAQVSIVPVCGVV